MSRAEYAGVPLALWPYVPWQAGHDGLMGPFRWRVVNARGTCFDCGARIKDLAFEKERGMTRWLVCANCPGVGRGRGEGLPKELL